METVVVTSCSWALMVIKFVTLSRSLDPYSPGLLAQHLSLCRTSILSCTHKFGCTPGIIPSRLFINLINFYSSSDGKSESRPIIKKSQK